MTDASDARFGQKTQKDDEDECSICGTAVSETNLGWSEVRDALVCVGCIVYLQDKGHYPDESGPERETTITYEVTGRVE